MTDEQIAELLARSHAAFVATIMDALQLDWAPPAPTGRPVVERCKVVRPVVERCEVATCEVVERCEVATCEVVERCEVARQEVATCQVVRSLVLSVKTGQSLLTRGIYCYSTCCGSFQISSCGNKRYT